MTNQELRKALAWASTVLAVGLTGIITLLWGVAPS